jgi:hypothetical protein
MFDNKKCPRCRNKVRGDYEFCPFCGNNITSLNDRDDYGLIGKNDFIEENVFPEFGGSMMDKVFDNAFKMAEKLLEKQMKSISEEMQNNTKERIQSPNNFPGNVDIQFFVNGKRVLPDSNGIMRPVKKMSPIKIENKISEEKMKQASKLPRKEAISKVRRLSGKLIYELEMPGVNDIDNVLINQLENSIEVKALSKTKVYHKTINVKLPILKYSLNEGNLILELAEK